MSVKMQITKKECGSTMDGAGNTCFFNSVQEGVRRYAPGLSWMFNTLYRMMNAGGWSAADRGKMVETATHGAQIETLAQSSNVCICVYSEVEPNVVNVEYVQVFGNISHSRIRVVKILNCLHYNLITNMEDENLAGGYERACFNNQALMETSVWETSSDEESTSEKPSAPSNCKKASTAQSSSEKAVSEMEKRIVAQEKVLEALKAEIISWGETLTAVGEDDGIQKHLEALFIKFRDAHDTFAELMKRFAA
jgi:hypothetical protein